MLRIVEGAPEERRRYLNLSLGQVMPRYAADLAEYARLLAQRNALLKLLNERGGDPGQLAYWDEQLAELGARIIHARIHALRELERLAARLHHELTRGQEILRLDYQPSYDPLPTAPDCLARPIRLANGCPGRPLRSVGRENPPGLSEPPGAVALGGDPARCHHHRPTPGRAALPGQWHRSGSVWLAWPGSHRRAGFQAGGSDLDETKKRSDAGFVAG